ncbi:zinc finger protein swm isoform X2 [Lutzomyia longipalpis]|uniref:zinc finger protein swm isoform X2 n=1 Tax=Lutzomyia longipalpis TaxID=7200 RepID=UPI00248377FD|nr:zinc finger protein swm isoform X2 [Lutzomyia longipalpis]
MHVNNPEALKSWLAVVLKPLCDAEPCALARYVLALLKKDKPIRELTQCMTEQLDVFLGPETKPFLERLLAAIKTEEYITQAGASPAPAAPSLLPQAPVPPPPTLEPSKTVKGTRECTPPLDTKAKEIAGEKLSDSDISPMQMSSISDGNLSTPSGLSTQEAAPLKFVPESVPLKDVPPPNKETRRRRASMRSRSRSRSRSFERNRKSRSRDRRLAEREKSGRQYRKSPRRYDRRERSPKLYGGRVRNRSHSQSRSRSGSPRKVSRSMSPNAAAEGTGGVPSKRQRCRDFDEKGYCMRGETCPWDHGVDPVVLEDINNPLIIAQSTGTHMRGVSSEYNPDAPDMWTRGGSFMGPRGGPHRGGLNAGTYPRIPGANFRPGAGFSFPLNPSVTTPLQRELISVPVVDANGPGGDVSAQMKRRFEPEDTVAVAEGPAKRKPIGSRLGPRMGGGGLGGGGGGPGPKTNCSLEIRKVPRGLNSIAHLNNHFSKFGKIVNIQISYDGDPEAAIVTFSEHFEANVAYRSTEAVLNNRFIKVFWHIPGNSSGGNADHSGKDEQPGHMQQQMNHRKPFPPNQYQVNNLPANPVPAADPSQNATATPVASTSSGANASTTTVTPQTAGAAAANAAAVQLRLKANRLTRNAAELLRKKQEEKVKAAVQLAHGLHKRKHELLQESLKQMRSALELMDRVDSSDPQRPRMMQSVKDLQDTIEKLREEIAAEQAKIASQTQNVPPGRKSKEQHQKELLDVELELIALQQEGQDTTAIQKKLLEMQRTYRVAPARAHFPGRAPRVRPAPPGSTSVDRRPTTLYITGFQAEDSDAILGHFKHFGEITKNELDVSIPLLTISFATRLHAEQAMIRGRIFKEKPLQVSLKNFFNKKGTFKQKLVIRQINWSPKKVEMDTQKAEAGAAVNAEAMESVDMESVELRIEDEEEEEDAESEDRSWRR